MNRRRHRTAKPVALLSEMAYLKSSFLPETWKEEGLAVSSRSEITDLKSVSSNTKVINLPILDNIPEFNNLNENIKMDDSESTSNTEIIPISNIILTPDDENDHTPKTVINGYLDTSTEYNHQEYNHQEYNHQEYNHQEYNNQEYNNQEYNNQEYNNQNQSNFMLNVINTPQYNAESKIGDLRLGDSEQNILSQGQGIVLLNLTPNVSNIVNLQIPNNNMEITIHTEHNDKLKEIELLSKSNYDNIFDSYFNITISEGKIFKCLIDQLAEAHEIGSFILSENNILYSNMNDEDNVLTEVVLRSHNFLNYDLESTKKVIGVSFNMQDFKSSIPPKIAASDSIKLSTHPEEDIVYIENSSNSQDNLLNLLTPESINNIPIHANSFTYQMSEEYPNVRVKCTDFALTCTAMASSGSKMITCRCYPRGFIFIPYAEKNKRSTSVGRHGEIEKQIMSTNGTIITVPDDILGEINISKKTLKYLSKVRNLNSNGILKIYYEPGQALKLICQIGGFGEWRAYIW